MTDQCRVVIKNLLVEYEFDGKCGCLRKISHKRHGRDIILSPETACAKLWLGKPDDPNESEAIVSAESGQHARHRFLRHDGGTALEFTWPDLKDAGGSDTGIELFSRYELDDGAEFLRINTRVYNHGDMLVTGLFIGLDGVEIGGDDGCQVLSVPDGTMGSQWVNPRKQLSGKPLVMCMPPTPPLGMMCGWMDIGDGESGLATGYLNRQGMDMIGEVTYSVNGLKMGWRMFRYQGGWTFMEQINGPLQVYPLRPGESFATDDWFIGLHAGDWHGTAQFYRREYERVFDGDFLTWKDTSPAVRTADCIFSLWAADRIISPDGTSDVNRGIVKHRFADIPAMLRGAIDCIGIDPRNALFILMGQTTHWGICKLPDYFPTCAEAGGDGAFLDMARSIREEIGVAGMHLYAHAAFNHPEARDYAASADTGWSANLYANYDHIGRVACMECEEWWRLWKEKIIPGFVERGAGGIEFDEGFGHHFICSNPKHKHGSSSASILTAQTRGAHRIFRECRKALGPGGYLESEGGSDVGARHFDLWENNAKCMKLELTRYTHPDKMIAIFADDDVDVCRAFVFGLPVLRSLERIDPGPYIDAVRKFVVLRSRMRMENAPGYPYAFRDEDGLRVSGGVFAKLYADGRGMTVAYYSKGGGRALFEVDCSKTMPVDTGIVRKELLLESGEIGYFTILY